MITVRRRVKHLLTSSKLVRGEIRSLTNFAHFAHTRNIFAQKQIDLVLDVGANKGQFASEIRSFYRGEIFSFEPVAAAFAQLKKAAEGDSNWKCVKLAMGSKNESGSIRVAEGTQFSSFLKQTPTCQMFGHEAKNVEEEEVPIRRLDQFLHENVPNFRERRIFLKVDTQGFDLEVVKGLGDSVRYISALQSEVSVVPLYEGMCHWTECMALYERAGFVVAGMFPVTLDYLRVIEFDCLMVREENLAAVGVPQLSGIAELALPSNKCSTLDTSSQI